jgi:hypothetical protein
LIDKDGNVVKKSYDGLKQAEVNELIKDIKELLKD